MKKWKIWLLVTLGVAVVAAAAAAFYVHAYLRPFQDAENTMDPTGRLTLWEQEDGTLLIQWPAGIHTDRYLVELLGPAPEGQADPSVLFQTYITGEPRCVLPAFPRDAELTLRISSEKAYRQPGKELWRSGQSALCVTAVFAPPEVRDLTWMADTDLDQVEIRFSMDENSTCRLYAPGGDGQPVLLDTLSQGQTVLTFGEGKQFPLPNYDESQTVTLQICSEFEGYTHYGLVTGQVSVVREDLLGTDLALQCADNGNNVYTLTWDETKGEGYQVQMRQTEGAQWHTLCQVSKDGERSFTTDHLTRYSDYFFRVVAPGADGEPIAVSETISVHTGASVVYSTIWPQKDLEIYSDTGRSQVIGTAPASQAYCALDLVDGMFRIRVSENVYGYIDSNYCMINLPEMIGDLCAYNITNSYASLYMAHGYEIPTVTGEVIKGYENVRCEDYSFLVPLLYPTALKLEQAAFAAVEQGYRLVIYDSFRPRQATQALYAQAKNLEDSPLPESTFSGEPVEDLPQVDEGHILTYGELMTDFGRYTMNYFLAAGASRHNQGVALDLTLEKLSNGKEVEMQTPIHDLSWYSEIERNNTGAKKLASIMNGAGFTGLVSEWWHFQDNEARHTLAPEHTVSGVTARCWMGDDTGWRYRRKDGTYYTNQTVLIDGTSYSFDENGYVIQSE